MAQADWTAAAPPTTTLPPPLPPDHLAVAAAAFIMCLNAFGPGGAKEEEEGGGGGEAEGGEGEGGGEEEDEERGCAVVNSVFVEAYGAGFFIMRWNALLVAVAGGVCVVGVAVVVAADRWSTPPPPLRARFAAGPSPSAFLGLPPADDAACLRGLPHNSQAKNPSCSLANVQ